MPINPMIWSEVWNRAVPEPIGMAIDVENPVACIWHMKNHRPPGFEDYTIARSETTPNTIYIIKPGVTMEDPEVLRELGLAPDRPNDQTPDLED